MSVSGESVDQAPKDAHVPTVSNPKTPASDWLRTPFHRTEIETVERPRFG